MKKPPDRSAEHSGDPTDEHGGETRRCPFCEEPGVCAQCRGTCVRLIRPRWFGGRPRARICSACDGTGECTLCRGSGRVPETPGTGPAGPEPVPLRPVRPWTPRRKAELVLDVLSGRETHEGACSRHSLEHQDLAAWTTRFLEGGKAALASEDSSALDECASWVEDMQSDLVRLGEEVRRRRDALHLDRDPLDPHGDSEGRFSEHGPIRAPARRRRR